MNHSIAIMVTPFAWIPIKNLITMFKFFQFYHFTNFFKWRNKFNLIFQGTWRNSRNIAINNKFGWEFFEDQLSTLTCIDIFFFKVEKEKKLLTILIKKKFSNSFFDFSLFSFLFIHFRIFNWVIGCMIVVY